MEVTTSERQASGGPAPELPARNVVEAFYAQVDRLGDDLAIVDEARGREVSWTELRDTVRRSERGFVPSKTTRVASELLDELGH